MGRLNKIKEAAQPLQQILEEYYDPMHIIVISSQNIEVFGSKGGIPNESVCKGTFDSESGYFVPKPDCEEEKGNWNLGPL